MDALREKSWSTAWMEAMQATRDLIIREGSKALLH
jgi:hypothetical protein